jgi:hypothetical protein
MAAFTHRGPAARIGARVTVQSPRGAQSGVIVELREEQCRVAFDDGRRAWVQASHLQVDDTELLAPDMDAVAPDVPREALAEPVEFERKRGSAPRTTKGSNRRSALFAVVIAAATLGVSGGVTYWATLRSREPKQTRQVDEVPESIKPLLPTITLPQSRVTKALDVKGAINLLMNVDGVHLDGLRVADTVNPPTGNTHYLTNEKLERPLKSALDRLKEGRTDREAPTRLALWLDTHVTYSALQELIFNASRAGFDEFVFVVEDARTHAPAQFVSRPPKSGSPRNSVSPVAKAETKAVIEEARPRFRRCYAEALQRNPGLQGTLRLYIVVGPDGLVSGPDVTMAGAVIQESTITDQDMQHCLLGVARELRFPPPDGGRATIQLPLRFVPEGEQTFL